MVNRDITYCNGKGCALRNQCKRYQDGQRIIANRHGDSDQHRWMDNCDPDYREGYISIINNEL